MKILLFILLFFYLSIGMIIGLKIVNLDLGKETFDKWYKRIGFIIFKMMFWLPNIPADIIVSNMEIRK